MKIITMTEEEYKKFRDIYHLPRWLTKKITEEELRVERDKAFENFGE